MSKRTQPRWLKAVTTVFELVGAAAIAYGVALIFLPAGIIVGGAALIGLSYVLERGGVPAR
ncbi:hypothetical protein [Agromyces sp. SYSU T00194]|uniref:hypothetical protein n=1 Tax=Agromyces chitinivorans TaxID=3158560 RepID=UPI00339803C3